MPSPNSLWEFFWIDSANAGFWVRECFFGPYTDGNGPGQRLCFLFVARVGLAAGESPFVVSAVKTVNDWFDVRDRATPMGIVNGATTMGQAIAPPILTVIMLAFGWRGMFMLIGVPGVVLSVAWYAFTAIAGMFPWMTHEKAYFAASGSPSNLSGISFRSMAGPLSSAHCVGNDARLWRH
jgi:MFS family permease